MAKGELKKPKKPRPARKDRKQYDERMAAIPRALEHLAPEGSFDKLVKERTGR